MWTATPDRTIANNSAWGTGEFLMMRTNFEVKDLDHDCYRISILANQGYHIYLNGQKIHTFPISPSIRSMIASCWTSKTPGI